MSLPSFSRDKANLSDLLCEADRLEYDNFRTRLLRPLDEVKGIIEEQGEICPYMDPVLKRNYRSYLSFLRNLRSRGLLRFTRHPEEMVAVFVAKRMALYEW